MRVTVELSINQVYVRVLVDYLLQIVKRLQKIRMRQKYCSFFERRHVKNIQNILNNAQFCCGDNSFKGAAV